MKNGLWSVYVFLKILKHILNICYIAFEILNGYFVYIFWATFRNISYIKIKF